MSDPTTQGTVPNAGDRETALRLAALHPADRDWMLARLPDEARARLQLLLDELEELGFRIDADALAGMPARKRALPGSVPATVPDAATGALMTAHADQIRGLFANEPAAIVHAVLEAQRWPWADMLRDGECHGGYAPDGALTMRTRRALIEAASARLPEYRGGLPTMALAPASASLLSSNMLSRISSVRQWAKRAFGHRIGRCS